MNKLNTIQKRENLNLVYAVGEKGNGGAYHKYMIVADKGLMEPKEMIIEFQHGPRLSPEAEHGVVTSDLLEICRDQLTSFQQGTMATRENAIALTHIEEALLWLNKRVEDRIEREVLGTMNK